MRVARFVCVLAIFAVVLIWSPRLASAAAASSEPASAGDEAHFRITLEDGTTLEAARVEALSLGSIRYRTESGEVGFLNRSKIRAIEDASGRDRRAEVLIEGRSLGTPLPEEQPSMGRWVLSPIRHLPDRARKSYFLAEFGASGAGGTDRPNGAESSLLCGAFGGMKGLGRHWAMGGVAEFHGNVEDYHFVGAGLRVRRYLNDFVSLQGTTGLFAADYSSGRAAPVLPVYADAGVTFVGAVTFFGRIEHHRIRHQRYAYDPTLTTASSIETDNVLRFGLRFGPRPLFPTVPLAILTSLAALSSGAQASYAPRPALLP